MCYTVEQLHWRQVKYLKRYGSKDEYHRAKEEYDRHWGGASQLELGFVLSGFSHPNLLVISSLDPLKFKPAQWGLIPHWCKSDSQAQRIWNSTLNARGETMFEKPSFKHAARNNRCIVLVNSFYEFHHRNKSVFPFRILSTEEKPLLIAGLLDSWTEKQTGEIKNTLTIVTTKANSLMSIIHNNPKLEEPRMPLILDESTQKVWMNNQSTEKEISNLIVPVFENQLQAHTVRKLSGRESVGNVPEAIKPFEYKELTDLSF